MSLLSSLEMVSLPDSHHLRRAFFFSFSGLASGTPRARVFCCCAPLAVFMWVPTLQGVVPGGVLPTGLIFSSFMVCITVGGILFSIVLRKVRVTLEVMPNS